MERLGDLHARMREASPPGRLAGRFFKALAVGRGNLAIAAQYAEGARWVESRIIGAIAKAAVSAPGTDVSMYYPVGQDVAALVAKVSAMRQLPGFRGVPGNTNCITQAIGAVAYWGAEGTAVPLSSLAFAEITLVDHVMIYTSRALCGRPSLPASDGERVEYLVRDLARGADARHRTRRTLTVARRGLA